MHRRKLPIGIQTFAKMREEDYYYSAPRRFVGWVRPEAVTQHPDYVGLRAAR